MKIDGFIKVNDEDVEKEEDEVESEEEEEEDDDDDDEEEGEDDEEDLKEVDPAPKVQSVSDNDEEDEDDDDDDGDDDDDDDDDDEEASDDDDDEEGEDDEMGLCKTTNDGGKDPYWKHGVKVQGPREGITYVQCKYCSQVLKGGMHRLKNHLANMHKDARLPSVHDEIYREVKTSPEVGERQKEIKRQNTKFLINRSSYYQGNMNQEVTNVPSATSPNSDRGSNPYFGGIVREPMDRNRPIQEVRPQSANAKKHRNQVCLDIGRFFFENGIPFNVASSPSFANMLLSVSQYATYNNGHCVKPPSVHELRTWILKEEVEATNVIVKDLKKTWPLTGVTIISDGWKDMSGRQLINFLVDNPKGIVFLKSVDASDIVKDSNMLFELLDDVVEEVGEENVVQVVTDNAANYKAAGNKLMEKRKHLYWTPCATHCIDLMFEDLFSLPKLANAYNNAKRVSNYIYNHGWVLALMKSYTGRDLIRPTPTRFGTGYLTLESFKKHRQKLEQMFASSKWTRSQYARQAEGKAIRKIVLKDNNFWPSVTYSLKATKPLFHVWKIINSKKTPAMGFLYDAMDKAKEEIAKSFDNELAKYKEIWDIIDKRWDTHLHKDLHAAAYFLNPQIQLNRRFSTHFEIKQGLFNCIDRLLPSVTDKVDVHLQMDKFIDKEGLFGRNEVNSTRHKHSPASWWIAYGDDTPELTHFAIRVLSLTCSSSVCERNWSTFNHVHTKKRNRLTAKRLNALVYVMYNKRLRAKKLMMGRQNQTHESEPFPMDSYVVDSDNEWLVEPDLEAEPLTQTIDGGNCDVGNPPQVLVVSNPSPEAQWHQNLDELDVNAIKVDENLGVENESRKRKKSKQESTPTHTGDQGLSIGTGIKQLKTSIGLASGKGEASMHLRNDDEDEY